MTNGHHFLRQYRKAQGVSCADMAQKLGVKESTLRSYENGNRRIPPEFAINAETRTDGDLSRQKLLPNLFREQAA
jgi:transcriptional regulator with XRE-family HTH domain